jgi:putative sigma-54 modulation protein
VARPKARAAQPDSEDAVAKPTRARKKASAVIAVHSFPNRKTIVEPHLVTSSEAVALKAMTIEEAVKEAEFRDRDLLVFRNPAGELHVLYRRRDGEMELVELS